MNAYVTAGEDYSGDNTNEQDDTSAQASQEIAASGVLHVRWVPSAQVADRPAVLS